MMAEPEKSGQKPDPLLTSEDCELDDPDVLKDLRERLDRLASLFGEVTTLRIVPDTDGTLGISIVVKKATGKEREALAHRRAAAPNERPCRPSNKDKARKKRGR